MDPLKRNIFNTAALKQTQEYTQKNAARKTAEDFEAVFLTQAFDKMFSSVKGGAFSGGHAEETWKGFLAQEYAKQVASSGETGIADSIEKMISAYQKNLGEK